MRELSFTRAGVSLFAVVDGADDAPVLVMCHGGMANHLAAEPLVRSLADRYRVVLPDLRGSGRSVFGGPLSFVDLADDLAALLDALRVERAIIGGASSGTGTALKFAMRHPDRTRAVLFVKPSYAGEQIGYTEAQREQLRAMDAVCSRVGAEGIEAMKPLYDQLPPFVRDKAWKVVAGFDPASVMTTSKFLADGVQPFARIDELRTVRAPVLLFRGDDVLHPRAVSDLYEAAFTQAQVEPVTDTMDVAPVIRAFCATL
jgi:pimeloyl-ACP methyl ester carboxylesterase